MPPLKDPEDDVDVSVIIPTHNRLWALPGAIESVQEQRFTRWELIVVDDGSTDGTRDWIKRHAPRVRYIYQENRGVSAARNRGIAQANGRYIAFLDSDDRWMPEKLARQVSVMEAEGAEVSYTDEIWIRNKRRVNPKKRHKKFTGDIFLQSLPLVIVSPSSVMIQRLVLSDVGLFDEMLLACEDYDLWLRITSRYHVRYIDEALIVKTGGHDDQLSHRFWGLDMLRLYALEKILNTEKLSRERARAVMEEIVKKGRVVLGGAKKRGNDPAVRYYEDMVNRYERLLEI
ncbi:MAG: glycosyltransferase [Deltaproteobacteria bacterium]|nr:glycosyltransferase [Candidatus Zymogenaceae bacterium]